MTWFGLNWGDILLNTAVLAFIPLLLAAWGGHLAAEAITDPKNKRNVKLCFWSLFAFGVGATVWQQVRSAEADLEKNMNNNFAMMLAVQKMWPPPSVPVIEQKMYGNAPTSRLEFLGLPIFAGTSPNNTEGAAFSAGDPLGFNVHYSASGPNPVKLLRTSLDTEVVPNFHSSGGSYDEADINQAVDVYLSEVKKEEVAKSTQKPNAHTSHTIVHGENDFNTAYAWKDNYTKHQAVTQADLDGVKSGAETFVVFSVLTYSDGKSVHHLRRCTWLIPPGSPPGLWHYCEGFPDSD